MLVGPGTAIAVHEDWNYRAGDVVRDRRGWGRYTLRLMRGAAGKDAIFGTVYRPQDGSAHWKVHEKEMAALRNAGERGIGDDPRHQFYLDLFQELFEHFGRGVAMVIGETSMIGGGSSTGEGRTGVEVAGKFRGGPEAGKCHRGEAWEPITDQA